MPGTCAEALVIAEQGRGLVEPNPLVGCVVAHGAEIIGEGFHNRFGGPHAEVIALSVAGRARPGQRFTSRSSRAAISARRPPAHAQSSTPVSVKLSSHSRIRFRRSAAVESPHCAPLASTFMSACWLAKPSD